MAKNSKNQRKVLQFGDKSIIIKMYPNSVKKIIIELDSVAPSDQSGLFLFNLGQAVNKKRKENVVNSKKGVVKDSMKFMEENNLKTATAPNEKPEVTYDSETTINNEQSVTVTNDETVEDEYEETTPPNQYTFKTSPFDPLDGITADYLITRFELDKFVPVNLDAVLQHYNISLRATDFKNLEEIPKIAKSVGEKGSVLGAVREQDSQICIYFKESDSVHRQRFTIAHELAHCCFNARQLSGAGHIEYRLDIEEPPLGGDEYKANVFAGELLIPKKIIDNIYETIPKPNIKHLAELFNVSVNVMKNRLIYLKREF